MWGQWENKTNDYKRAKVKPRVASLATLPLFLLGRSSVSLGGVCERGLACGVRDGLDVVIHECRGVVENDVQVFPGVILWSKALPGNEELPFVAVLAVRNDGINGAFTCLMGNEVA